MEMIFFILFSYCKDIGRPTFVPALHLEMGFEKIVRIAHARGGKVPYLVPISYT